MNKLKNAIESKIIKTKESLYEYLSIKKSIGKLVNSSRKYFLLSKGFDEIYLGIENSRKFFINKLICILCWMASMYHVVLFSSSYLYSLVDGPFLPDHFRTFKVFTGLCVILTTFTKTDFLLSEIKYKSTKTPYKIFYYLMNDKKEHHLTNSNYKKLAIISRIIQMYMSDYGAIFWSMLIIAIFTSIAIQSQSIFWVFEAILITPFYVIAILTLTTTGCIKIIYFSYYKLRFDQINDRIKSIISQPNRKLITLIKEQKFNQLLNEYELLATEIYRMNLCYKIHIAVMFVCFSLIKITSLFLMVNVKNTLIGMFTSNIFAVFFFVGFSESLLYSHQIKSAHKSYKVIYSIVCNYRMRFKFKLKVRS